MTLASTMDALVQQVSSCFTKPSFQTFCVIAAGWLLGHGRRTVTHVLLAGDGLRHKTVSGDHRFFSQARWSVDQVGRVVLQLVLKCIPRDAPLVVAVDDTLNRKTGKRIWAAVDGDTAIDASPPSGLPTCQQRGDLLPCVLQQARVPLLQLLEALDRPLQGLQSRLIPAGDPRLGILLRPTTLRAANSPGGRARAATAFTRRHPRRVPATAIALP